MIKTAIDNQTQRSFNEFSWEKLIINTYLVFICNRAAIVTCQRSRMFFNFCIYLLTILLVSVVSLVSLVSFRSFLFGRFVSLFRVLELPKRLRQTESDCRFIDRI